MTLMAALHEPIFSLTLVLEHDLAPNFEGKLIVFRMLNIQLEVD